jgi:hypothetical protein
MAIAPDSGFWAHGRLSPYAATRFNVQQASAAPDVNIEVFADGIAVWSWPGAILARSVEDARDLMGLVTAAYTVRSEVPLDCTFTGWVEATRATFDGTMIGFTVPRGHKPHMNEKSKRSRDMAAAIDVAVAVFQRGPWRLAVRDVHSAYLALATRSDDVFVFAYRAVEDLAHAVSKTGRSHGQTSTRISGRWRETSNVERRRWVTPVEPLSTETPAILRSSQLARK